MTRRPRPPKYRRAVLGGGNVLKAVTRTRRAAVGRVLGKAPGKQPGPANWRVHRRRLIEAFVAEQKRELEQALLRSASEPEQEQLPHSA